MSNRTNNFLALAIDGPALRGNPQEKNAMKKLMLAKLLIEVREKVPSVGLIILIIVLLLLLGGGGFYV